MLDAVRLDYWQPDRATKRELAQAYEAALKATGQRDANLAVSRFAALKALHPAIRLHCARCGTEVNICQRE